MRTDAAMKAARIKVAHARWEREDRARGYGSTMWDDVPAPRPRKRSTRKSYARRPYRRVSRRQQLNENLLVIGGLLVLCIALGVV